MNQGRNSFYFACLKSKKPFHFYKKKQKLIVKKETLLFETR